MGCESKLTADHFDIFQRYKKASNKVISWLALTSGSNGQNSQSWSLKELKQAAEVVNQKAIEVPDAIYFAFQDAIKFRSDTSLYFKQHGTAADEETRSHEFFTKTLKEIFELVCPPSIWRKTSTAPSYTHIKAEGTPSNRYHLLSTIRAKASTDHCVSTDSMTKVTFDVDEPGRKKSKEEVPTLSYMSELGFTLRDDHLGIVFNTYYILQEMDIIMSKVKIFWEKAGSGTMSLTFAAWLTNAAFGHIQRNFRGVWTKSLGNSNNMKISAILTYLKEHVDVQNLVVPPEHRPHKTECIFMSGYGLENPAQTLYAFKYTYEMGMDLSQSTGVDVRKPSIFEKPVDYITIRKSAGDGPALVDSDREALFLMLDSIHRLDKSGECTTALCLEDLNPLVEKISRLSAQESLSIQTDTAFGLQLLLESYRSFLFADDATPTKVNCRLQALRFMGDVKRSVSRVQTIRPRQISEKCTCLNCPEKRLAKGIRLLEHDLLAFGSQKRFDLYHQAPWVAGTQMHEVLFQATDFGLLLCNRPQYVGSVLHLYNCLRQVGAIDKEPIILERLCNLMEQAVFKGPRPTQNFYSNLLVLLGGRLEFDRKKPGRKQGIQRYDMLEGDVAPFHGRDRTWRMTLPEFVYKNQLTLESQSHFYALNRASFDFGDREANDAWARFYGTKKGSRLCDKKEFAEAVREMYKGTFVDTLDRMEREVGPELEGEFPIARINWIEVYLTCTEILERIAIAALQAPASAHADAKGEVLLSYGVSFTETLLDLADEHASPGRDRELFPLLVRNCVGIVRDAITAAFQGKKTADYVWQIS